jgi:hypothetical protein
MELPAFAQKTNAVAASEIDRAALVGYYLLRYGSQQSFSVSDVSDSFRLLSLPIPNGSRLRANMARSRRFVQGASRTEFRLHANELARLDKQFASFVKPSEETINFESILPHALYDDTRGFIEKLAKQINASYEHNIFDGCAMLMRRLLEVLLIMTYEHLGIDQDIRASDGHYMALDRIVDNARNNKGLALSRNTKTGLDGYRKLGNFSAHKIYYNATRADLQRIALDYRATVEELLYRAGVRK